MVTAALTREERRRILSRVTMTLCNLGGPFRLFWLPSERRVAARSLVAAHRWPVPHDALQIGIYQHGVSSASILEDLCDLLERPAEPAPAAAPWPAPAPGVALPRCDREAALALPIPKAWRFDRPFAVEKP